MRLKRIGRDRHVGGAGVVYEILAVVCDEGEPGCEGVRGCLQGEGGNHGRDGWLLIVEVLRYVSARPGLRAERASERRRAN